MSPGGQPVTPDLTFLYQMDLQGMKLFTEKLELILNRNTDDLQVQVNQRLSRCVCFVRVRVCVSCVPCVL